MLAESLQSILSCQLVKLFGLQNLHTQDPILNRVCNHSILEQRIGSPSMNNNIYNIQNEWYMSISKCIEIKFGINSVSSFPQAPSARVG